MEKQDQVKEQETAHEGECHCPFCDNALVMPYPFCEACGAQIEYCSECHQAIPQDAEVCPNCGAEC